MKSDYYYMSTRIIFEYTPYGKYVAQGVSPSGLPGYNIWAQYADDDYVHYLGFIFPAQLEEEKLRYQALGNKVSIKGKPNIP